MQHVWLTRINYKVYQKANKQTNKNTVWKDKGIIKIKLRNDIDVGIIRKAFKITIINMLRDLMENINARKPVTL